MIMARRGKPFKFNTRKFKVLSGRSFKKFINAQARNAQLSDDLRMLIEGSGYGSEANCSKRQRVDRDSEHGCIFPELRRASPHANEKELVAGGLNSEEMDGFARDTDCANSQPDDTQIPIQETACTICLQSHGGNILCCDGKGCGRSFHLSCVDPPLTCFPPGAWHCIWCIKKIIQYGVHSVSKGTESILDSRDVLSDDEVMQSQKEYLVKYKGFAHVNSQWIPEREVLREAPILLARFKKNKPINKAEWIVPHRLIQRRLLVFPEPFDNDLQSQDCNYSDCRYMWLVKWTGLSYNNATWEFENSSFLKTPEAMTLKSNYEARHLKPQSPNEFEGRKLGSPELEELPLGRSNLQSNSKLRYVNILREYLYRGQNAVVFDDKERIAKVVLFIVSLVNDTRQPFLIVTPSNVISLWEAEFNHWASSSTNIVVYDRTNGVRDSIRHLEFYNEGGSLMFQILISPPDAVNEDLEMLQLIKWEAIILDECQRRQIYLHLKRFKKLAADMRLLLLSWQVKDKRFNYHDALSLLDPQFDGIDEDSLESDDSDLNSDISKLKERFSKFIAFECKSGASGFAEYWVPVHLSNVQVEQYCSSLQSNSTSLSSSLRNESVDSLHQILFLSRKCCDHPYLVDQSLQSSLTSNLEMVDKLDVGIKVSGKVKLLEKILLEIQTRGLRVLLFFQSDSGTITIGDILDDVIRLRFGENSYVRVDGEIKCSQRKYALNKFNNKESGIFVCLIDNRACLPKVTLSSVDIVVILDSDWNPVNDLKALQKINITSQFQPLKIFRFYSPFTLEEKALMLAKKGATLSSDLKYISWRTCQKLLRWNTFHLLSELDKSDDYENTLSNNVFGELSALLSHNHENGSNFKCSNISIVEEKDSVYCSNTSLLGENQNQLTDNTLMNEKPHVFWKKMFEGKTAMDKLVSSPSQRSRRKLKHLNEALESSEFQEVPIENKRLLSPPKRQRNRRTKRRRIQDLELTEITRHNTGSSNTAVERPYEECLPTTDQIMQAMRNLLPTHQLHICPGNFPDSGNNETLGSSAVTSECLDPIIEKVQKDKEEVIRNHEERKLKLNVECEREIAEIRKKYDGLLNEAELAFMEEKKDLETVHKNVVEQKCLADAMAKSQGSCSEHQEDFISKFMNEIVQQYIQKNAPTEQMDMVNQTAPNRNSVRSEPLLSQSSSSDNLLIFQPSPDTVRVMGAPQESGLNHLSAVNQNVTALTLVQRHPGPPLARPPLIWPWKPSSSLIPRVLSIPAIQGNGIPSVGSSSRSPAPHLRQSMPPFATQQPNHNIS